MMIFMSCCLFGVMNLNTLRSLLLVCCAVLVGLMLFSCFEYMFCFAGVLVFARNRLGSGNVYEIKKVLCSICDF